MTTLRRRLLFAGLGLAILGLLAWSYQPVRVVGRSMEPSLVEGDWLLVSRGAPDAEDLVVFVEPGTGKLAVKRVAGVPGERVLLHDGALLVDGEPRSRSLSGVEDLVPMLDAAGEGISDAMNVSTPPFRTESDVWSLPEGEEGQAFLRRPPLEDYLMRGAQVRGELPAADLGVEVDFRMLGEDARLELVLRKGQSTFTAALESGGSRVLVRRDDPEGPRRELYAVELPAPKREGRMFFSLAGGTLTLSLDGAPLLRGEPYEPPVPHTLAEVPLEFARFEHAGVGGRGPLDILRVRIGRGVLYGATGTYGVAEAFQLGDDQYFLLGDNPAQSRDSRHYGAVARDRILGVVSWRAWPGGWTERGWPLD